MATGADGPTPVSVILANRSGVNVGERFDLRISKEPIFGKAARPAAQQINPSSLAITQFFV
jgi:hypothetical protein